MFGAEDTGRAGRRLGLMVAAVLVAGLGGSAGWAATVDQDTRPVIGAAVAEIVPLGFVGNSRGACDAVSIGRGQFNPDRCGHAARFGDAAALGAPAWATGNLGNGAGSRPATATAPGAAVPAPIPLPAAGWLLLAGLGALALRRTRRGA